MSNNIKVRAIATCTGLLLFASIGMGLWELFQGLHALGALIVFAFVCVATFNTWRVLNSIEKLGASETIRWAGCGPIPPTDRWPMRRS